MSIYEELLRRADKGKRVTIDLEKKNLWLGRQQIIAEGDVLDESELIDKDDLKNVFGEEIDLSADCWNVVSYLFNEYKHSRPSEGRKYSRYFKALESKELSDEELAFNCDRRFAQAMIEGYVLCASLQGWLKWENDSHWFWQGKDRECIVVKQWVK